MRNEHELTFTTEVQWTEGRHGELKSIGLPTLEVAAPPEFQGRKNTWTPEHLYVGSVASCFMLTSVALAEHAKLVLESFSVKAEGKLGNVEGRLQITEIILTPTAVVSRIEDVGRVETLLVKAERNCFIAASIKSRVFVLPQVYHRQLPATPCPAVSPATASAA
ncbi:MAG TPA: OsmC family protein [Candidatus Binatia bacterium]|jgi:peroxiredoxin-like protein